MVGMHNVTVDEETGEHLERFDLRDSSSSSLNFIDEENNNVETGEPEEATQERLARNRVPFQIPRALQRQSDKRETSGGDKDDEKKSRFRGLPNTAEPFGQTNPIMLLIPLVFYCRWVIAVLMCLEVFLHVWAHHKNKRLQHTNVYFRSPFHSISSEFCAMCQNETCMNRVGKMQAIRSHKILRQCNYMKRVVT